VEADGNEAVFTFRDGRYVGTEGAGAYDTLVVTATWTDGDSGITETYLSAGSEAGTWRLTQITDTEGHSVRVTYDPTRGLIMEGRRHHGRRDGRAGLRHQQAPDPGGHHLAR